MKKSLRVASIVAIAAVAGGSAAALTACGDKKEEAAVEQQVQVQTPAPASYVGKYVLSTNAIGRTVTVTARTSAYYAEATGATAAAKAATVAARKAEAQLLKSLDSRVTITESDNNVEDVYNLGGAAISVADGKVTPSEISDVTQLALAAGYIVVDSTNVNQLHSSAVTKYVPASGNWASAANRTAKETVKLSDLIGLTDIVVGTGTTFNPTLAASQKLIALGAITKVDGGYKTITVQLNTTGSTMENLSTSFTIDVVVTSANIATLEALGAIQSIELKADGKVVAKNISGLPALTTGSYSYYIENNDVEIAGGAVNGERFGQIFGNIILTSGGASYVRA